MRETTLSLSEFMVPLEVKELTEETGEFVGTASPYGVKDLGNDIVEKGAFSKTIAEKGSRVPLLDSHQMRIGVAEVSETPTGLQAKGKINLNKQSGRDVYSDLKFYQGQGVPMGLSIGYQTIKADFDEKGVRHLKELALFEISVTEMPMNQEALVTGVKNARAESLERVIAYAQNEIKSGRKLSADTRRRLAAAMEEIQALLADGAADSTPSSEPAADSTKSNEPAIDHSAILTKLNQAQEALRWTN